jgi:hypothetical protein
VNERGAHTAILSRAAAAASNDLAIRLIRTHDQYEMNTLHISPQNFMAELVGPATNRFWLSLLCPYRHQNFSRSSFFVLPFLNPVVNELLARARTQIFPIPLDQKSDTTTRHRLHERYGEQWMTEDQQEGASEGDGYFDFL